MLFSLRNGKIPFLTTKKLTWKTCLCELLWFIHGQTHNRILKEQNVRIWNCNGSKEFLESRGLDYEENDLGLIWVPVVQSQRNIIHGIIFNTME